jgi:hypothetical protein
VTGVGAKESEPENGECEDGPHQGDDFIRVVELPGEPRDDDEDGKRNETDINQAK